MKARVIVASNRAAAGVYSDTSGPLLVAGLRALGCDVDDTPVVVPDGDPVAEALRAAVADRIDVVVTSGGTGVTPTDRTPEATRGLLDFEIPGIAEAIRASGLAAGAVDAGLSRGLVGVSGSTLVVNLASSRAAVRDGMATLTPLVGHVIAELSGLD